MPKRKPDANKGEKAQARTARRIKGRRSAKKAKHDTEGARKESST